MARAPRLVLTGLLFLAGCDDGSWDADAPSDGGDATLAPLEVSTLAMDFGDVATGNTRTLDVTLHNTTDAQLYLADINLDAGTSGDFEIVSGPESISLAPDASVDLRIAYTPSAESLAAGTLKIQSTDLQQTQVRVSGRGKKKLAPEIDVSPGSLAFGDVLVGGTRKLDLTIQNLGTAPLAVSEVSLGGARAGSFELLPAGWSASLAPGASQIVAVTFYPAAVGPVGATVSVRSDDADEATVSVALSGSGASAPAPEIEVAPLALGFGDVTLGSAPSLAFTVRNAGTSALQISSLLLGAGTTTEFSLDGAPSAATVSPGASFSVSVKYVPADLVSDSRTVRIESDDPDEPVVTVSLSGTGVPLPVPEVDVTPAYLDFGDVQQGSSRSLSVTLRNAGTATLNVSAIGLAAGTTPEISIVSGPSSANIAPGSSVSVGIRYAPSDLTSDSGTLRVTSNDVDEATVNVSLSGRGIPVPAPEIDVTPLALTFGDVVVGQSRSLGVTVRNTGTAALSVSRIALGVGTSGEFFIVSGGAPVQIAVGGSAAVSVSYTPQSAVSRAGTVVVDSNDSNEASVTVSLSGRGTPAPAPEIDVTPASLAFGDVEIGSESALSLTVRNGGTATLFVSSMGIGGGSSSAFSAAGGIASVSIAAGQSISLQVTYVPPAAGMDQGSLVVSSNDADEAVVTVPLTGNGVQPSPILTSATLAWDAPATSADGSPIADLQGYKLYFGTAPHVYSTVLDVGSATTKILDSMTPGTYYFAVTAYDSAGNESDFSLELSALLQ